MFKRITKIIRIIDYCIIYR